MDNLQEAIAKIESHERECSIRYANIEKRLESGSKRFDKLENMIWGVYPFIVVSVILAKFLSWKITQADFQETWIETKSKWT